jgi:hypothetical protein
VREIADRRSVLDPAVLAFFAAASGFPPLPPHVNISD